MRPSRNAAREPSIQGRNLSSRRASLLDGILCRVDCRQQLVGRKRLRQRDTRAEVPGKIEKIRKPQVITPSSHRDDSRSRVFRFGYSNDLDAVARPEQKVCQHDIEGMVIEARESGIHIRGLRHLVSASDQCFVKRETQSVVILDEQNRKRFHAASLGLE